MLGQVSSSDIASLPAFLFLSFSVSSSLCLSLSFFSLPFFAPISQVHDPETGHHMPHATHHAPKRTVKEGDKRGRKKRPWMANTTQNLLLCLLCMKDKNVDYGVYDVPLLLLPPLLLRSTTYYSYSCCYYVVRAHELLHWSGWMGMGGCGRSGTPVPSRK